MKADFDTVVAALRAAGEGSRLRILALLRRGDLSVGELVEILGQSQPGVSQHLKTLAAAGLVERLPEGAFVYYRLTRAQGLEAMIAAALDAVDEACPELRRDEARLTQLLAARAETADDFFEQNARSWDDIRAAHYPGVDIESAILEAVGPGPFRRLVDIGTGTGRILSLLGPLVAQAEGVDRSHEMLTVARANLARDGVPNASVRKGDATALPIEDGAADLVIIHQVLHYVPRPALVIAEAARILAPGGRLVIVDFAPHALDYLRSDHAHLHLGLAPDELEAWAGTAGLSPVARRALEPAACEGLTVQICAFDKPGRTPAKTRTQSEEVAL